MGWLRLVGSLKLQVSFAEHSLFYRALLQKRPIILRSLLIVATPYTVIGIGICFFIHRFAIFSSENDLWEFWEKKLPHQYKFATWSDYLARSVGIFFFWERRGRVVMNFPKVISPLDLLHKVTLTPMPSVCCSMRCSVCRSVCCSVCYYIKSH